MKGLSQGTSLITFKRDPDDPDYYVAELGMDGVRSSPFCIPVPYIHDLLSKPDGERLLGEYLERQASVAIERWGDGRCPRPDPVLLDPMAA